MFAFRVLAAISLDNQTLLERNKIHDPWSDRSLATKLHTCKATRAKQSPERDLGVRCLGAESFGKGSLLLRYALAHPLTPPLTRPPSAATLSHKGRGKEEAHLSLRPPLHHHHDGIFDQHLEGADQFGAERTVDRAVIAGQRDAHDVGGLDLAAPHHRPLLAGADREDRSVRRVDHGGEILDTVHAEVGHRRGAALVFV